MKTTVFAELEDKSTGLGTYIEIDLNLEHARFTKTYPGEYITMGEEEVSAIWVNGKKVDPCFHEFVLGMLGEKNVYRRAWEQLDSTMDIA